MGYIYIYHGILSTREMTPHIYVTILNSVINGGVFGPTWEDLGNQP